MNILIYIISAVVLLGLCVFVHELGHLLGGKMVGIKAKVFSLGYGKGFIKKKWGDTTYQITLIPFGGYCSFYGENAADQLEGKSYEFFTASPWRRIVVVIMGPLFNLFFGILIFFVMNMVGFEVPTNKITIPDYYRTMDKQVPALKYGLQNGDIITAINGAEIESFEQVLEKVVMSEGETLNIEILRDSSKMVIEVVPEKDDATGYYAIGIWPYGENILVAAVVDGTAAQKAGLQKGDVIQKIGNESIETPLEFNKVIRQYPDKEAVLTVKRGDNIISISTIPEKREVLKVNQLSSDYYGEKNKFDGIKADDFSIIEQSIKEGNVKINNIVIKTKKNFISIIQKNKGKEIELEIPGGIYKGIFEYESFGFLGISPALNAEQKHLSYSPVKAFSKAMVDPFSFIYMNLKGMKMLFSGQIAVRENLSGPIRIAKIAGDTAYYGGIKAFILLMAKISIILMIMNLLPIPAVDGSYILMFLYEGIRGKRIDEKVMQTFQMIGFMILVTLFIFIMYNDISQLLK